MFLSADLRTAESVNAVVQQAVEVLGGLDILVNNAEHAAIVNISSNATDMSAPPLLHYAAAKAALNVYVGRAGDPP